MNPEEFHKKMMQLKADFGYDEESVHIKMDNLMCELLTSLGYQDGVNVFKEADKWYS